MKIWLSLLLILAFPAGAKALTSTPADARLRAEIHDRLLYDARVQVADMNVETLGGEVTLRGTVSSLPERAAAIEVAAAAPGVRALHNELVVTPDRRRSDEAIRAALIRRIETAPDLNGTNAVVGVHDGVVILTGVYPSLMVVDRVVAEATQIEGVRDVRVVPDVRPPVPLTDRLLTKAAAGALQHDRDVDTAQIRVGARDGVVVLEGAVPSLPEILRAEAAVRALTGVRAVQNRLSLVPSAPGVG